MSSSAINSTRSSSPPPTSSETSSSSRAASTQSCAPTVSTESRGESCSSLFTQGTISGLVGRVKQQITESEEAINKSKLALKHGSLDSEDKAKLEALIKEQEALIRTLRGQHN